MISPHIQKLFTALSERQLEADWSSHAGPRFVTNHITSKVSSWYERLRYVVDYHEEHMLRRAAIERILRRLIIFGLQSEAIGRELLEELVRARYVENDVLPEDVADDVQAIIEKYAQLDRMVSDGGKRLWAYAAVEIERLLFPASVDEVVFQALYQIVKTQFAPKQNNVVSEKAFNLQVYIACRRVFLRESHAALDYSLLLMMMPAWQSPRPSHEDLSHMAEHFERMHNELVMLTGSRIGWRIAARLKNESIYFNIIRDLVTHHGRDAELIFADPERLRSVVTDMLAQTYATHQQKIQRSGTRAIMYILITKIVVGLAIELPYEVFILNEINYLALAINMALFPMLMVLMVKTVSYPDAKNTDNIIAGVQHIIASSSEETPQPQYIVVNERTILQKLSYFIFFATFFSLSFGIVLSILNTLHFNHASIGLFILFLCIVTYMGLHIRNKAREWTVAREDESFLGLVTYLLLLPVTSTGEWISRQLSSMNIFVFFMDFILETPFKVLLGSFDAFISYTKELKRDGV